MCHPDKNYISKLALKFAKKTFRLNKKNEKIYRENTF